MTLPRPDEPRPVRAWDFLVQIAPNWRLEVPGYVAPEGYEPLTDGQKALTEEGAPPWLRDEIARWRMSVCDACAAHPDRRARGRCGASDAPRGCSLRAQR